jgi:hypothetical protein
MANQGLRQESYEIALAWNSQLLVALPIHQQEI